MQKVAIVTSKGGTGKTLIAVSLAIELSKKYKVGLLDLDLDNSNEATLLGLESDIQVDIETRKMVPREYNGLKVFAMSLYLPEAHKGVTISDAQRKQFIIDAINNVAWGELDYLICDLPGGTGIELLTLYKIDPECRAILVTQPNQLESCARSIDVFTHYDMQLLGIVENMSGSWMHGMPVMCGCGCGREFAPFGINTVPEAYSDIAFLGRVPLCQEIFELKPPLVPQEFDAVHNIIKLLEE